MMDAEIITSKNGFLELEKQWNMLNERSKFGNVFLSWEWQYNWWDSYGKGAELRIILIRDKSKVIAILPLYIKKERIRNLIPVNVLRLIGTGGDTSPDYLGLIVEENNYTQVVGVMVSKIIEMNAQWDWIELSNMRIEKKFENVLLQKLSARGFKSTIIEDGCQPYIDLPGTWDEYLKKLSSNRRYQIRKSRRTFEDLPGAKLFIWDDVANADTAVDSLKELHLDRWQGRAVSISFSSNEYVNFHRSVIKTFLPDDKVRLFCLQVEDSIIAMLYCYKWKDSYYYFQGGFSKDYQDITPGAVLMSYAIERAIEEGCKIFDMLKGDYRFKRSLAKNENKTHKLIAANTTMLGKILWLRKQTLPHFKYLLKERFCSYLGMIGVGGLNCEAAKQDVN